MSRTGRGYVMFAVGTGGWIACFAALRQLGTWLPFAVAGPLVAAIALAVTGRAHALAMPPGRTVAAGLAAGGVMVALTHLAFALAAPFAPEMRLETRELLGFVGAGGLPRLVRAGLIVLIAVSEEIIFRGPLASPSRSRAGDLARVLGLSAIYSLATLPLASPLLAACAFGCGVIWGTLAIATRSVIAAALAHAIWSLSIMVIWRPG